MRPFNHQTKSWNLESYFLMLVAISYFYEIQHFRRNPDHVHQLNTFEELRDSILDQTKSSSSTANASNETYGLHVCPIDKDRLVYFYDNYQIDRPLNYNHIKPGGSYQPNDSQPNGSQPIGCKARQKVAIIIPYRKRANQLEIFTQYIHQFLPDQLIDYTVYVLEQADDKLFNRAKLFNVGMVEIRKLQPDISCFIFHDVDLIPLDQKNLYMCSTMPRHISASVNTMRFRLLYPELFGGIISMTGEQYDRIGGFSNDFYGWGGEDDDIFERVISAGYDIERTPKHLGIYLMLRHKKNKSNPDR